MVRRLKTGRIMVKDEDVCLHCGLCAERCPPAVTCRVHVQDAMPGAAAAHRKEESRH